MGIFKFSAVFKGDDIKISSFAGERIAIDAYHEYYRASLGAAHVSQLTDADGNRTLYLNVILSLCAEFQKNNVDQIWIFDNASHQAKSRVLAKRKQHRQDAQKIVDELDARLAECDIGDNLDARLAECDIGDNFDAKLADIGDKDDADVDNVDVKHATPIDAYNPDDLEVIEIDTQTPAAPVESADAEQIATMIAERHRQEKRAFQVVPQEIERMKHMFDLLGIKWIDAPAGVEAEQLAARMSANDYVHAVYSGDTDPIAFGAKKHYRRVDRNKLVRYTQVDLRRQIATATGRPLESITQADIIKICVVLGCDFAQKTPGIGERTVLKKYTGAELTEEQKTAIALFNTEVALDDIFIYNLDEQAFGAEKKRACIEWLVTMGFNMARLEKMLGKVSARVMAVDD